MQPKVRHSKKSIIVVLFMLLAIAGLSSVAFAVTRSQNNSIDGNSKSKTRGSNSKAISTETTLQGTVKLATCGGAQPNYPEPPACAPYPTNNVVLVIIDEDQSKYNTKLDENGDYAIKLKPGQYNVKVTGESTSAGHAVTVATGKNTLNFSATFHTP